MAANLLGLYDWDLKSDDKGHRDYGVEWLIQTEDAWNDGPGTVFSCPGLPDIGQQWAFGNEIDPWAFCRPGLEVKAFNGGRGEPTDLWVIKQVFSTRPLGRDGANRPQNPLLEPADISGTFAKYRKEALSDRDGKPITNSSKEIFKGNVVERDFSYPTVTIAKNFASVPLGDIASFIDCVSSGPMWGLEANQVKLSNVRWQKLYYSVSSVYYKLTYEFDVNYDKFKCRPVDQGTRIYKGFGDPNDVSSYIVFTDSLDEIGGSFMLDGEGFILLDTDNPVSLEFDLYPEANLLLLGIPSSL
jgi:hypothetical protein